MTHSNAELILANRLSYSKASIVSPFDRVPMSATEPSEKATTILRVYERLEKWLFRVWLWYRRLAVFGVDLEQCVAQERVADLTADLQTFAPTANSSKHVSTTFHLVFSTIGLSQNANLIDYVLQPSPIDSAIMQPGARGVRGCLV